MVNLANQLAIESPQITATAIDATEYPDLVRRYNVNGVQTIQLFDLRSDPLEMKNLAADPVQASRVGDMTTLLKRWMRETDDHLDLDKPDWGYQLKQAAARPIEDQSVAE